MKYERLGARSPQKALSEATQPHLSVLGLSEIPDKATLKEAFHRRAIATHPDKEGGDEEEFKRVSGSNDVLAEVARSSEATELRQPVMAPGTTVVPVSASVAAVFRCMR